MSLSLSNEGRLLPMRLTDIVGQEDAVARLRTFGDYYKSRGLVPEPILLIGNEGMGKRTIARAFLQEQEMDSSQETDGTELQVLGDLTAILTNLRKGQGLVISNIELVRPAL